jgi:hypothetical protein
MLSLIVCTICGINSTQAADSDYTNDNVTKMAGDWKVIKGEKEGINFCYAYTVPFRTKAFDGDFRNHPYIILETKGASEVSLGVNSGFVIDGGKGYTIKVNDTVHLMNIKLSQNAWTYSAPQDTRILNDMIEDGHFVEVSSYDNKDHIAVDYYSLKGFTQALKHLYTNCEGIQKPSQQDS